jgi:hypothetical protein
MQPWPAALVDCGSVGRDLPHLSCDPTMHASSAIWGLGGEPTYSGKVFKAILEAMPIYRDQGAEFRCDDRGAWLNDPDRSGALAWHPQGELEGLGQQDPLESPWLPFPFTARQLAALLSGGSGFFIQQAYGEWGGGPDETALHSLGQLGGKAREVLIAAYGAYRKAAELAPRLDQSLESKAQALNKQYLQENALANEWEGILEPGITADEYTKRRARAVARVAGVGEAMFEARLKANAAEVQFRKAVVMHLLLPVAEVPDSAFESPVLRTLPPSRRAEAIYQLDRKGRFLDSPEGQRHWELTCALAAAEAEVRRWKAMAFANVTEALGVDARLQVAETSYADARRKLDEHEAVLASVASLQATADTETCEPIDRALLATRNELLAAYEAFGLKQSWFAELKSHLWLLAARKVTGQGQRGSSVEPLFCPYKVMLGLTTASRNAKLNVDNGWRIFERRFPAAYRNVEAMDPRRDRTG